MADKKSGIDRRAVLRGSLTATAAGAFGLATTGIATAAPRGATAAEPRIYSTAEWGARAPSANITILNHVPTYIVVHHTAGGNSTDYSLAHAQQLARDIQAFHMDGNGWIDSGQQFTNSRGGHLLEGRHESLPVARGGTQHVQGANVGGHNSEIIGIENEGLYTSVDVTSALWNSLVAWTAWVAGQYGRPVENIMGHRDFNSTECPGDVLYGRLQELRDAVAGQLGVPQTGPIDLWPLLRPGDTGPRVRAAQHLLRARGFSGVTPSGTFDGATRQAVARLATVHGIEPHSCTATRQRGVDETGYLGSDIWPLITPRVTPGENADVSEAVAELRRVSRGVDLDGALTDRVWKRLLA